MSRAARIALGALVAAVLGLVVATVVVGARVREETVVANPYEEGLRLGKGAAAGGGCDLGAGPCTRSLPEGGEVRLELSPRPLHAMADLAVRADLPEGPVAPGAVAVSFAMRGMDMGENRSRLRRTGPGRWEGKAILVRCPSGRREWTALVEVAAPGGAPRTAGFTLTLAE